LWSDRWERPEADLFQLQDDIATAVAGALRARVSHTSSSSGSTSSVEAHQLFLKGRFYWTQRTEHGFRRAIEHYRAALEHDPGFARAYAALADTYILVAAHHLEPPAECFRRARECANRAIELDPKLAAGYPAMAATLLMQDRNPVKAEQAWKTALALDPSYAYAWHGYSVFGAFVRPGSGEALAAIQQALKLEPLSAPIASDVAVVYYYARDYQKSIKHCLEALDLHPSFARTHVFLARSQAALNLLDEAVETCVRARPLFTGRAFLGQLLATLGFVHGRLGETNAATGVIHELEELGAQHFVSRFDLGLIYTGLGDVSRALECLEAANEAQEFWAIRIPTEPLLSSLHAEPRFQELARRIFPFGTHC
jgi:tetratricopeptide (TPR) repeat protein